MPNTGPPGTQLPLRQALSAALRSLIATVAVPGINAALSAYIEAASSSTVPQFTDADIVVGDLLDFTGAVICVIDAGEKTRAIANGLYDIEFYSKLYIKATAVADNAPEDFACFFSVAIDNIRDVLTQASTIQIRPVTPIGSLPVLPFGSTFVNCRYLGAAPRPLPVKEGDGVTYIYGYEVQHRAAFTQSLYRPNPLGG